MTYKFNQTSVIPRLARWHSPETKTENYYWWKFEATRIRRTAPFRQVQYNNTHPKIIWKTILVYSSDYFSSSTSSRSKINDRPSLCSPRLVKIPTVRNVRSRVKFLPKLNKIPSSKVGNKSAWLKFSNLNYSSGRSSDWPLFLLSLARR